MNYQLLKEQRDALLKLLWDDEENILWGVVYLLDDLLDKQWEAGIIREELEFDALQDAAADDDDEMSWDTAMQEMDQIRNARLREDQ